MKFAKYILLCGFLFLTSCAKTKIDGASLKTFQTSANDLASRLSTIKQIKFNEALFIIKTYGTHVKGDVAQMQAAAKLLNGKNVQQVFAMADQIARENNVEWSSTAPPSLGEMNIFGNSAAQEIDANNVPATAVSVTVQPIGKDSLGPKALLIIPRLKDANGDNLQFTNATLETTLELFSAGVRLMTSRNFMTSNNFKGFTVNLSSIPADKVTDGKIDAKITVKTTNQTLSFTTTGITVNPLNLKQTAPKEPTPTQDSLTAAQGPTALPGRKDPKATVSKFIGLINTHNLNAAYQLSKNPKWESFNSFSNNTSGFGAIQSISADNVSIVSETSGEATVSAACTVKTKEGKETKLNATYHLKLIDDSWQIVGYQF